MDCCNSFDTTEDLCAFWDASPEVLETDIPATAGNLIDNPTINSKLRYGPQLLDCLEKAFGLQTEEPI